MVFKQGLDITSTYLISLRYRCQNRSFVCRWALLCVQLFSPVHGFNFNTSPHINNLFLSGLFLLSLSIAESVDDKSWWGIQYEGTFLLETNKKNNNEDPIMFETFWQIEWETIRPKHPMGLYVLCTSKKIKCQGVTFSIYTCYRH